mmetsp:Transcript_27845/g.41092  ORF Transcript_27845/g.41092 Transcript_27845/m.41092 type:complete len:375 (-) Transcript_27845:158-1282(-)|eukprot:CAMPEP_0194222550 /NCGR_PEP_ID=MMETSP0156-20130528/33187_1 /TAXON_ID=33649 /ORGANISM="Thalassionema nitzschioides, Strain L26-B" /LENGTH=374 /DNA_ID=CAMNT_0038953375 /DNA_START=52 /DNA_END=1176 /DNA_ORIENTATION=+
MALQMVTMLTFLLLSLFVSDSFAWNPQPLRSSSSSSQLFASVRDDASYERSSELTNYDRGARVSRNNRPQREFHQEHFYEEPFGNRYQDRRRDDDDDERYYRDLQQGSFNRKHDRNFGPRGNNPRYGSPDYDNEPNFYDDPRGLSRRYDKRYDNHRYGRNGDFEQPPYDGDMRRDYPLSRDDDNNERRHFARMDPLSDLFEGQPQQRMPRDFEMTMMPFFGAGPSLGMFAFPLPFISPGFMNDEMEGMNHQRSRIMESLVRDAERYMNDDIDSSRELGEGPIRVGPIFSQSSSSSSMNGQTRQVIRLQAWAQGSERTGSIRLEATERGIEELVLQMEDENGNYRDIDVKAGNNGMNSSRNPSNSTFMDAEIVHE